MTLKINMNKTEMNNKTIRFPISLINEIENKFGT